MEKISVIVTVYNRLNYLKNMITCLIDQTSQIEELIIADDGSSEKIMDFVGDLIPKCKFKIKHVYQEDNGFRLAKSRNNAARVAEGDYLIFLDQDVIFGKNFIKEIIENKKRGFFQIAHPLFLNSEESKLAEIRLKTKTLYENLDEIVTAENLVKLDDLYNGDRKRNCMKKFFFKTRGAKLAGLFFSLYREDFIKINGLDEKYCGWGYEDDDFCNRLYAGGMKSTPLRFGEMLFHIWHKESSTKKMSLNEGYYRKRKKEISKKDYRCEYGVETPLGEDKILCENLN